ncbi:hypothetical protein ABZ896_17080 [Streptomyces sp. NPDC047072]|uniref:hypothetical protein n=1 Tax=Streptomyces sp. NPDC047072 TaxID=3154809 RepID=UPI0033F5ACDF
MAWHRQLYAATATAVLVVVVAACSDRLSTQDGSATGKPLADVSSSSSSDDGSGSTAGVPLGAKVLGTVRLGEAFVFTLQTAETSGEPQRWKLVVRNVDCGKPLDPAVMAYAADSVGAPTATPVPDTGKQFCVLTMDGTNVGKSMANWDASNTVSLNVGDVRYTESQQDADYALDYAQYWNQQGQTAPAFGLNPGSQGPVHGVFEIPAGDKPTNVWVTAGTAIETIYGVQPGYLVLLQ